MMWVNLNNAQTKSESMKDSNYNLELVNAANQLSHYPRDVNKHGLCIAAAVTAALVVCSWLVFISFY